MRRTSVEHPRPPRPPIAEPLVDRRGHVGRGRVGPAALGAGRPVAADAAVDVNPWTTEEWPREPADRGAWDHRPDPAAVDTGFYVDWGTAETEAPPGWDAPVDRPTRATG